MFLSGGVTERMIGIDCPACVLSTEHLPIGFCLTDRSVTVVCGSGARNMSQLQCLVSEDFVMFRYSTRLGSLLSLR